MEVIETLELHTIFSLMLPITTLEAREAGQFVQFAAK